MYKYDSSIEKTKIIEYNNEKIVLYPKYLITGGIPYYDKALVHDDCIINYFIMNILNGILEDGCIEEIDNYLVDYQIPNNKAFISLEKDMYQRIKVLLEDSNTPRIAIINLLERLNYSVDRRTKKIVNPRMLTDLMVTLFLNDKVYSLGNNKSIITCKNNIYETFYNYLIMDYEVNKCPRITFGKDTFHIDWSLCDYLSYKEENLKKDIELIKKMPREDRYKYLI